MTSKMQTGLSGEALAAEYLRGKGYEIVEYHYRHKHAEIDLIAKKGSCLIFVEVKTRSNSDYGYPEEFVDAQQQRAIFSAADSYIEETNWQHNIRFDIISILGVEIEKEVTHFEDAFY